MIPPGTFSVYRKAKNPVHILITLCKLSWRGSVTGVDRSVWFCPSLPCNIAIGYLGAFNLGWDYYFKVLHFLGSKSVISVREANLRLPSRNVLLSLHLFMPSFKDWLTFCLLLFPIWLCNQVTAEQTQCSHIFTWLLMITPCCLLGTAVSYTNSFLHSRQEVGVGSWSNCLRVVIFRTQLKKTDWQTNICLEKGVSCSCCSEHQLQKSTWHSSVEWIVPR